MIGSRVEWGRCFYTVIGYHGELLALHAEGNDTTAALVPAGKCRLLTEAEYNG